MSCQKWHEMNAESEPTETSAVVYWEIEYEIPPLRAIYNTECTAPLTEGELRQSVEAHQPMWKIRKLTKVA